MAMTAFAKPEALAAGWREATCWRPWQAEIASARQRAKTAPVRHVTCRRAEAVAGLAGTRIRRLIVCNETP
jgi:hypothetical protein